MENPGCLTAQSENILERKIKQIQKILNKYKYTAHLAPILSHNIHISPYLALLLSSLLCAAMASCLDGNSLGVAITLDEIAGCQDKYQVTVKDNKSCLFNMNQ